MNINRVDVTHDFRTWPGPASTQGKPCCSPA